VGGSEVALEEAISAVHSSDNFGKELQRNLNLFPVRLQNVRNFIKQKAELRLVEAAFGL
jgi:hypothetical protein